MSKSLSKVAYWVLYLPVLLLLFIATTLGDLLDTLATLGEVDE